MGRPPFSKSTTRSSSKLLHDEDGIAHFGRKFEHLMMLRTVSPEPDKEVLFDGSSWIIGWSKGVNIEAQIERIIDMQRERYGGNGRPGFKANE